jgi:hypothetical protein
MTPHAHGCLLCSRVSECDDAMCEVKVRFDDGRRGRGVPWERCPDCEAGLAKVEQLPKPRRPHAFFDGLVLALDGSTRRAIAAAKAGREDEALSVLCEGIDLLAPADPAGSDTDTWSRVGAAMGARAAWTCTVRRPPPDMPTDPKVVVCYNAAYFLACYVVNSTRMEMMNAKIK